MFNGLNGRDVDGDGRPIMAVQRIERMEKVINGIVLYMLSISFVYAFYMPCICFLICLVYVFYMFSICFVYAFYMVEIWWGYVKCRNSEMREFGNVGIRE